MTGRSLGAMPPLPQIRRSAPAEHKSRRRIRRPLAVAMKRVFAAPRDKVWNAWTDHSVMARWLPPVGFSIIECSADVRYGGAWRFHMRAPDGEDFRIGGAYREITAPERLVFTCRWNEEGPETLVKVTLFAIDGATAMTFRQTGFTSRPSRDGHGEGWGECFDQLADTLNSLQEISK